MLSHVLMNFELGITLHRRCLLRIETHGLISLLVGIIIMLLMQCGVPQSEIADWFNHTFNVHRCRVIFRNALIKVIIDLGASWRFHQCRAWIGGAPQSADPYALFILIQVSDGIHKHVILYLSLKLFHIMI